MHQTDRNRRLRNPNGFVHSTPHLVRPVTRRDQKIMSRDNPTQGCYLLVISQTVIAVGATATGYAVSGDGMKRRDQTIGGGAGSSACSRDIWGGTCRRKSSYTNRRRSGPRAPRRAKGQSQGQRLVMFSAGGARVS